MIQKTNLLLRHVIVNINFFLVSSIEDVIKPGKCFVFWGLEPHHHAVAVVGLGKKCKGFNAVERIDEDKEAVRIASAGIEFRY